MQSTYPSGADGENVPVMYGSSFSNPVSYLLQAKMAFQFAARYGSNASVSSSLLSVNTSTRWTGDPANTVKKGLGLIRYIECDNERDKWWKGRNAYQTGREYAANLSAFYDGNKNTMGAGVGVKNADPNMQVVMGGVACPTTDYLKGMIDWCNEFRGYNADGSVNLCWDVINYHIYPDNGGSMQGAGTRGAAPEVAHADTFASKFIAAAHAYARDMPVWVTETGYDINQGSVLKAIPIGSKTALQTQADWILRNSLLYARMGVERTFFYMIDDEDTGSSTKFSSSGLINANHTRKPAADYLRQANRLMGEYVYKETISTSPIVDRYELSGNSAYVLVNPTETGASTSYTLHLSLPGTVKIYHPVIGQDSMSVSSTTTSSTNTISLTVTETPTFVIPNPAGTARTAAAPDAEVTTPVNALQDAITVYPNPTTGNVHFSIDNENQGDVNVNVYTENGQVVKSLSYKKSAGKFTEAIDISYLPNGLYLMEVGQGSKKAIKKIIKVNR
jgi:endoglucanase